MFTKYRWLYNWLCKTGCISILLKNMVTTACNYKNQNVHNSKIGNRLPVGLRHTDIQPTTFPSCMQNSVKICIKIKNYKSSCHLICIYSLPVLCFYMFTKRYFCTTKLPSEDGHKTHPSLLVYYPLNYHQLQTDLCAEAIG